MLHNVSQNNSDDRKRCSELCFPYVFFCSFLHHHVSWREDAKQIGRPPILKLQAWKKRNERKIFLTGRNPTHCYIKPFIGKNKNNTGFSFDYKQSHYKSSVKVILQHRMTKNHIAERLFLPAHIERSNCCFPVKTAPPVSEPIQLSQIVLSERNHQLLSLLPCPSSLLTPPLIR